MHNLPSAMFVALLALSGCNAASAPEGAPPERRAAVPATRASTPPPATAAASATPDFLQGLDCDLAARACAAPGYAISGSAEACESDGASFGAISDETPVAAVTRFRGTDAVATLAPGQFVCIHYTAQPTTPDGEPWLYVTAISPRHVPACATAQCGAPDAQSHWLDARAGACDVRDHRYGPACPAGWVRGTSVDAYSMGL